MNISTQEKSLEKFCLDHNIEALPEGLVTITGEELAFLLGAMRQRTTDGVIVYREEDILKMLRELGLPKPKWGVLKTKAA